MSYEERDYEGERADDQIKEDKIEKAFELDNLKFEVKQLKAIIKTQVRIIKEYEQKLETI
tara:strand:+ start:2012 stop:2191 length:180 start_codon:yes stop_codon:yes gene_type:complete